MNQAVIEQDGMSRNTPANPTPDSLTGLLLPLSDRTLLLPNVAVAELIAYRNPQVAAGLPQWYLGQVAWRDLRLPLLSFEAASSGEQQPVLGSSARVVVINALGGRPHVKFLALLVQGIPRSVRLDANLASTAAPLAALELAAVDIGGETARIPDLAGHRFEKHSHDEFVISANLCGLEDVWLDGRTFQADSGDLTLYNPGQIQGGGVRDGQPWRFASLYLPAAELASSLDLSSVEFDRPLLRSPALGRELAASIEALLASDRFARERGEERLLDFLGRLLAASGTRLPQRADPGRPAVARLQALLAERLAEPPDLDEMAEQVGLSKYHLLRAFKKATGLSPRQWSMQLRTRRALGLLRRGLAVGEVAHALGFADQSHLTRYFTSAYGISPGRYQRAVRG